MENTGQHGSAATDNTDNTDRQSMDPTFKDFESAVAELDGIVKTLEEGDLALEKSLELYERGVQLARFCHSTLEGAERRIELLSERGEIREASSALGLGSEPTGTK